jgi:hypothetical protein
LSTAESLLFASLFCLRDNFQFPAAVYAHELAPKFSFDALMLPGAAAMSRAMSMINLSGEF